jgi:hypothetical protein
MRRRLAVFALSSASGALSSALAPIVAVLVLVPIDYGLFSIPYLIYAFGVSLQYSVVSEAWARLRDGRTISWREYTSSLGTLAAVVGLAAGLLSLLIAHQPASAILICGAVPFAVYQSGTRYYRVATGSLRRVVLSDGAGILGFGVGLVVFHWLPPLAWVSGAWMLAAVSAVVVLGLPRFAWGAGLFSWIRRNHAVIRPLLLDSLLMDAGAIGTPFLLAGLMGPRKFGIYRAVANVAVPVRLLAEPLRPILGRMPPRRLFSVPVTVLLLGLGAVLAAACYVVLVVVLPHLGFQLGTLIALVPFALPSSLFVAGNLYITVYYYFCRTNADHRQIIIGRFSQTALVVALPLAGFAVAGLGGAIWGFALSSLIAAVVWMVVARLGRSGARASVPPTT